MATRTSVGSGAWNTAGTWDTGIPADGDDVVIASGHTVIFDADQSAFTTGVGITITGTLTHTTAAGSYCMYLKTGASVVGAGTWNIGTSGAGAIPATSKHKIIGAEGHFVDGVNGLTVNIYGVEPTNKFIRTTGAEAIGQTEWGVDTDVTGDLWSDGDYVVIVGTGIEIRQIATDGISADHIDVTAGLTAAKISGAYIFLINRNITFISNTTRGDFYRMADGKLNIGCCGMVGCYKPLFFSCTGGNITGGAYASSDDGIIYNSTKFNISNAVLALAQYGIRSDVNINFDSCHLAVSNFTGAHNTHLTNCTFYHQSLPYSKSGGNTFAYMTNCSFIGTNLSTIFAGVRGVYVHDQTFPNTYNHYFDESANVELYNVTFGTPGVSEFLTYNNGYNYYSESRKHNGVDDALKSWTAGGIVSSQTSVMPTGYALAYIHALAANLPCFFKKKFLVLARQTISIEVQLRKDGSMTYLPRVYLMDGIDDPLVGSTPVDTFTMTDSTDTWESDTFTIDNSAGTSDKEYTLWFVGKNASGNVYSAYDITTAGGAGGGVSRSRVVGGAG